MGASVVGLDAILPLDLRLTAWLVDVCTYPGFQRQSAGLLLTRTVLDMADADSAVDSQYHDGLAVLGVIAHERRGRRGQTGSSGPHLVLCNCNSHDEHKRSPVYLFSYKLASIYTPGQGASPTSSPNTAKH